MRLFTVAYIACILGCTAVYTTDAAKAKSGINNSGIIPGTNITIYDVRDENGEPMDFDDFLKGMLPMVLPAPDVSSGVSKRSSPLVKRGGDYDEREYVRRWCVLQKSTHPLANPYHETLLGRPNGDYYIGTGRPIPWPGSELDCALSATPCPLTATADMTYTDSISYTVTDSTSGSVTNSLGGAKTVTNSSSVADTVSTTFETNWSHTNSHTEDHSLASTTGTIGTKGGSDSTNNVRIDTNNSDNGGGSNWNHEDNGSSTDEKHWSAGFSGFGASVSGGGSSTDTKGHSDSKGGNTSWNNGHQDGWNNATNKEDNWSQQTQDLTTETSGTSDTSSDTSGGSNSKTNSKMVTKGVDISVNSDWTNSTTVNNGKDVSKGNTVTTAKSDSLAKGLTVPVGMCMGLVCFPKAEMMVLQYLCADTEEQIAERVPVAVTRSYSPGAQLSCRTGMVTCGALDNGAMPLTTFDDVYRNIGSKNALRVGGVIDAKNPLVSNNGQFSAVMEANGNFVIYRSGQVKVWETGATPFVSIPGINQINHRVKINTRGHLTVETQNLFTKVKPSYQIGAFRQTWSTQPIANNYTVGSPRRGDNPYDDYILVLNDNGILVLFDAMYIRIWCSTSTTDYPCTGSKGYRYQENYLVPTDVPTPETGLSATKDPQNNIIYKTAFATNPYILSRDVNCTEGIRSGTGIQSPNGRFKVIVYPTGNLVIKDGTRTMWASNTANIETTVAPYRLFLTAAGDLVLEDAVHRWLWTGRNTKSRTTGPYKATISDIGKLVVTDNGDVEVWDSWPHTGLYEATALRNTERLCYEPCGECATTVNTSVEVVHTITAPPVTITTMIPTVTTTTIADATPTPAPNPESILNKCKTWMDTYKIDPFVSWGGIEKDTSMQAQWVYYDCACFGTYSKYKPEILRTHLGKWGTLTNTGIRKQYTESYCDCPVAQDVYKIVPNPKNWGTLGDATQRSRWTTLGCDANVNREPFITNAQTGGTTVVPPTWTTLANYTTNISDRYITTFTNTTSTTIGLNVTVGGDSKTTNVVITSTVIDATMTVTDSQTIAVTTGYTVTAVRPGVTTTANPTTTTTTTTGKPPTPTCSGGKPGVGDGSGTGGQCCKTEQDCKDSCVGGKCGVCGKDFSC
ncbi:hypothetical protein K457DRAFT_143574 [Linnemannia elongata AG-77]|uniref:Bulb-type lectin domain-containing protein n=1 Tax=Linnemannia elongata AG-77 TaxID=1314771 RepID=A0A197JAQ5_9FUNG|nr:hypothetical protein K457DRAFT_143574 [Linnemannia elongata AG-77]